MRFSWVFFCPISIQNELRTALHTGKSLYQKKLKSSEGRLSALAQRARYFPRFRSTKVAHGGPSALVRAPILVALPPLASIPGLRPPSHILVIWTILKLIILLVFRFPEACTWPTLCCQPQTGYLSPRTMTPAATPSGSSDPAVPSCWSQRSGLSSGGNPAHWSSCRCPLRHWIGWNESSEIGKGR